MIPGTLVLLGSPLLAPGSWAGLPDALEAADHAIDVLDVHVPDDETPPYGQRYVTAVARAAAAVQPRPPLVLVAHSGAGPLLPAIGRAMRDAGRQVGGYLFVDAGLPATGVPGRVNRLELMRREDPELAITVEAALESGGRFPTGRFPASPLARAPRTFSPSRCRAATIGRARRADTCKRHRHTPVRPARRRPVAGPW